MEAIHFVPAILLVSEHGQHFRLNSVSTMNMCHTCKDTRVYLKSFSWLFSGSTHCTLFLVNEAIAFCCLVSMYCVSNCISAMNKKISGRGRLDVREEGLLVNIFYGQI